VSEALSRRSIAERLRDEGLDVSSWSNGPGDRYDAHEHGYDKVIVVATGSIVFGLPDAGRSVALGAGDRLELPARTRHDATVGSSGVSCLEAHLPAGRFAAVARRVAGEW
jgi:mannose-6-phosphate isomerase-like protein (cupin superfamily)